MYFIFSFRYTWGHIREKNTVQGFPPVIYTILIFCLKALSTKTNVATIIKMFSTWAENKNNLQFQSLNSIQVI